MPRQLLTSLSVLAFALIIAWPAQAADNTTTAPYRVFLPAVLRNPVTTSQPSSPTLPEFVATVADGAAASVRGIYVAEHLALPVVQQPAGDAGYVSSAAGVATQFGLAANYGVTGLLAHNYLAGAKFAELALGDVVTVVYGDGHTQAYQVSAILRYQALQPNSASSSFVDLETGQTVSATDVFARTYTGAGHVTLQTCIAANGLGSWGRLFVIATPVN